MNYLQKEFEQLKIDREVDEHNESHEFRQGYVKAMCHAINRVKNLNIPIISGGSHLNDINMTDQRLKDLMDDDIPIVNPNENNSFKFGCKNYGYQP